MTERTDVVIIGGGIAGVSAALTCRNRGKSVIVISNPIETGSLYKAESVTNYPGITDISGKELSELLRRQLIESDAELVEGRVLSVMNFGSSFGVAVGSDFCTAEAVILALGITRERLYPGEGEFLGKGVSYCATCDAMLYRGKKVALIGNSKEAYEDAELLRGVCEEVLHFSDNRHYEIYGEAKAEGVRVSGEEFPVDGVFVIKDTVSVSKLVEGLEYRDGAIITDRKMQTSIRGIFAAGDCVGKPYQLAKAAGEGNVAALSACEYLQSKG